MYEVYVLERAGYPAYVQRWRKFTGRLGESRNGEKETAGWSLSFRLIFYCAFVNRQRAFLFEQFFEPGLGAAYLPMEKRK